MNSNPIQSVVYVAFLRGINVGGHHKVPMPELRSTLEANGFSGVKTLLNSGNVVFEAPYTEEKGLEQKMSRLLEKKFGFPIPLLIRTMKDIQKVIADNPFEGIEIHKDLRLYVTFLRTAPNENPTFPYVSPDESYQVLTVQDRMIFSVLDVSRSKTTDAMKILEKNYSKDITTRNWNTLVKISDLMT